MENQYRSPTGTRTELHRNHTPNFWRRFTYILLAMVGLNLARLLLTWHAYGTDGHEQIGFPFVAFERGGLSYSETIHWQSVAANSILAFIVAYYGARLLRDGWHAAFRKLQTWGVEDAT